MLIKMRDENSKALLLVILRTISALTNEKRQKIIFSSLNFWKRLKKIEVINLFKNFYKKVNSFFEAILKLSFKFRL